MVRRTLAFAAVLVLSLAMGCSTTQKWMAGGAAVGAAVGGGLGAHHAAAGCGAGIGALAGATAGALVGNIIEEKHIREELAAKQAEIDRLTAENNQLKSQLADANRRIAELEAELARLRKQLEGARNVSGQISLGADVLFRPGSAMLSANGKKKLDEAVNTLNTQYKGQFIMIEGHTDSQPIRVSKWKSNWELGAARSLTVLHYLTGKGVDPAMMSAATFSKYQAVAANDTKEGRQQNRRAVITIYSNWPKATVAGQ